MKIEGLTKKQRMFCDIMYKFDFLDQIHDFIESLPEEDRKLCIVAYHMMLAEALDQNLNTEEASEAWKELRQKWTA